MHQNEFTYLSMYHDSHEMRHAGLPASFGSGRAATDADRGTVGLAVEQNSQELKQIQITFNRYQ